jgi:carbonic anhydrase
MFRVISVLVISLFMSVPAVGEESGLAPQHRSGTTSEKAGAEGIWSSLMQGNKRFMAGKPRAHELERQRKQLVKGQRPRAVVLTCSDSRVPPELIFDGGLGELFVVRAAGNVADAIGVGSIEYAVEHLGSSVLVVLGHEKCGAVTAACSGGRVESPNLQTIIDKIEPAVREAKNMSTSNELVDAAVLENIHQSAKDLLANSLVLRRALKENKLIIFEALYHLDSGEVSRLGKLSLVSPTYKLDIGDVIRLD